MGRSWIRRLWSVYERWIPSYRSPPNMVVGVCSTVQRNHSRRFSGDSCKPIAVMSHIGLPWFCFGQHRSFRVGVYVCMYAAYANVSLLFFSLRLCPPWTTSANVGYREGNLGNVVQCIELAVTSSLCVCVPNYYAILWCFWRESAFLMMLLAESCLCDGQCEWVSLEGNS